MVKPGGTGRPRLAISARPAPLPPRRLRMSARPSALPLPKPKTHFDLAEALAEGFLGGAFAVADGLRRLRAAFRVLLDLCSAVILSARALPSFRPRAAAAAPADGCHKSASYFLQLAPRGPRGIATILLRVPGLAGSSEDFR